MLIRHRHRDQMIDVTPEQANTIYHEVMNRPSQNLFARTRYGTVPFNELPEQELGQIYKEYANGNLEIINEKEI
jgi:hypothetical protein